MKSSRIVKRAEIILHRLMGDLNGLCQSRIKVLEKIHIDVIFIINTK